MCANCSTAPASNTGWQPEAVRVLTEGCLRFPRHLPMPIFLALALYNTG